MKIRQICISFKFSQSGCIPPKIKCDILAYEGSVRQLSPCREIITVYETANQ